MAKRKSLIFEKGQHDVLNYCLSLYYITEEWAVFPL